MKKVTVPEGTSGPWAIERFTISEHAARMALFSYGSRKPSPGTYTRLTYNSQTIMSDTPAECRDHSEPVRQAKGHILINGLGLGLVLFNSLMKQTVDHATVIENSEDVIKLAGPFYKELYGDQLDIVYCDALARKPPKGVRYDMVWHDIWPNISADNWEDMKVLHRKYGRRADWQGSWCRREVKRLVRQEREDSRHRREILNLLGGEI